VCVCVCVCVTNYLLRCNQHATQYNTKCSKISGFVTTCFGKIVAIIRETSYISWKVQKPSVEALFVASYKIETS